MIEVSQQGDVAIIRIVEAQLQMYAIPQFKAAVHPLLEKKPPLVIFDMEIVEHLDSSAMGAIFHFQKVIRAYGGRIALVNVTPKVMQVFKVTKSDAHLDIFDSVAEALKK